ncbi:phosphoribosyltransferase-like protein [Achromobacter aegrifaciens]
MAPPRNQEIKEHLLFALKLVRRNTWLIDKTDELVELLRDDCKTDSQRGLVTELFDRFLYVTQSQYMENIRLLAARIVAIPGLSVANTIVAAMANDSAADSSQAILQFLKTELARLGWNGISVVNRADHVIKSAKKQNFSKGNVIVVDEFIGSGSTAIGKKKLLERDFNVAGYKVNVFIRVLYCSSLGVTRMEGEGVDLEFIEMVKRGISDYESADSAAEKLDLMREIEADFSKEYGTHKMEECTLGYGGTESLFAIESGNIPNSVFPMIWWPKRMDGSDRKTLFTRYIEEVE